MISYNITTISTNVGLECTRRGISSSSPNNRFQQVLLYLPAGIIRFYNRHYLPTFMKRYVNDGDENSTFNAVNRSYRVQASKGNADTYTFIKDNNELMTNCYSFHNVIPGGIVVKNLQTTHDDASVFAAATRSKDLKEFSYMTNAGCNNLVAYKAANESQIQVSEIFMSHLTLYISTCIAHDHYSSDEEIIRSERKLNNAEREYIKNCKIRGI